MPARKTSALPTRIWKFCARFASAEDERRTFDLLRASNRYYNCLVEIEQARSRDWQAMRRRHAPELAAADDAWTALDDRVEAIYRDTKSERASIFREQGEKRRALPVEAQSKVEALTREKREVSAHAKAHRAAFAALLEPGREEAKRRSTERSGGGGPRTKSLANAAVLQEMLTEDRWSSAWKDSARVDEQAHAARIRARAACALPTGTYLGVEAAFERAKKDSLPRAPRFRSFRGEGKLQIQIKGDEVAGLLAGSTACTIAPLPHDPTKKGDPTRMRVVRVDQSIPRGPRQAITVTAKFHREPPSDAAVKWVALLVRRVGSRTTLEVQLTMEHASFAEPKRPAGARKAEHVQIGWSTVPDGVRVAHWSDGEVVVPAGILDQHEHASSIKSAADLHFVAAKKLLRRVMRLGPHRITTWHRMLSDRQRESVRRTCSDFARWQWGETCGDFDRWQWGEGRIKEVWREWIVDRKSRGEDLYTSPRLMRPWLAKRGAGAAADVFAFWCWCWAAKDAHLVQYAIDSQRRFEHRRDAFMRSSAIRIATEFSSITVDNYNIAELKRLEPLTLAGTGSRDRAQHQLQAAAPGKFREILCEVMGPRCTPCERPGDGKKVGVARKGKNVADLRGIGANDSGVLEDKNVGARKATPDAAE